VRREWHVPGGDGLHRQELLHGVRRTGRALLRDRNRVRWWWLLRRERVHAVGLGMSVHERWALRELQLRQRVLRRRLQRLRRARSELLRHGRLHGVAGGVCDDAGLEQGLRGVWSGGAVVLRRDDVRRRRGRVRQWSLRGVRSLGRAVLHGYRRGRLRLGARL